MVPIDVTVNNVKRNAHREFEFRVDTEEKKLKGSMKHEDEDDGQQQKIEPLLDEGSI